MQCKKIIHKDDFLEIAKSGINQVRQIVGRTLGPGGLPILLSREDQVDLVGRPKTPSITKDGVTVASNIKERDPFLDLVMQSVIGVARKTDKSVGDGTTTSIVLADAIFAEMLKILSKNKKQNPQILKKLVENSAKEVYKFMESKATKVEDIDFLEKVASISANGDKVISSTLREAFARVGSEGVITIDQGSSVETSLEIVEGFEIKRGLESGIAFTNDVNQTRFEASDVCVVLYDGKLQEFHDAQRLIHICIEKINPGQPEPTKYPPILLVANEFSQTVLTAFKVLKAEHGFSIAAVRSPHMTNIRTEMLDDLATMLDGKRLGNGSVSIDAATPEHVGIAEKVVARRRTTIFYGYDSEEEAVINRIEQLRAQEKEAQNAYDRTLISDRAASLACAVAKIAVGGATDLEILEMYHRFEDALNACRAALKKGVVVGGGAIFLKAAEMLESKKNKTLGDKIMIKALESPARQILDNLGMKKSEINEIIKALKSDKTEHIAYDALSREFVSAINAGIIDPVLVSQSALENAISISTLLSTSGGGIVFDRKGE